MLALGEAEMAFATDLLSWLCSRHIIGSITLRNAMLELRRYNAMDGARAVLERRPEQQP